jgi:hypothetical protein
MDKPHKKRGPPKGVRIGGRQKGAKNKATIAKEAEARARIAESIGKAKTAKNVYYAMDEMHKAISIAEELTLLLRPVITKDKNGKITSKGGDIKLCREWFGQYKDLIELLAKYQVPQVKPVEAPTPPPDPKDLEQKSRKRFGLRIFDGSRPPAPVVPFPTKSEAS